ncbi:hypothetical protein [Caballeronia sp. Lep1P3]|uniref:hypothetical protein n=1 Tax=Caballeronia sp. Lep1P3 TaxID=2878150 RepID=UPI001FD0D1B1|nr:hypothetical protein [Caballeronia sp. Lep1P3]
MSQSKEIAYKGHILTATPVVDRLMYAVTIAVRGPSGVRRSSGILGEFPSEIDAVRYAFAYGIAAIDDRRPPSNWQQTPAKHSDMRASA